ncbi:MAG: UDP-N-acetylmuramoyl-L-alanyl-D-glutamate--2,6-diaminopimelate ligase [Alphaproteobacteria bacterium]
MKLSALLNQPLPPAIDRDLTALTDDTRALEAGGVMVWDSRVKPEATAKVVADVKAKGGVLVSDVAGADVVVPDAGQVLAAYAAARWPKQPKVMMGVTGTSGKTSVAWFGQAMMAGMGLNAASVGTLGTVRNSEVVDYSGYTSPSALKLHPMLQDLAEDGPTSPDGLRRSGAVNHCVMEVSSHALALGRADGVRFAAAGITNVTQDHFDFHGDYAHYFAAKARLFAEVLPHGAAAVVNINRPELMPIAALAKGRGLKLLSVGTANAELVVEVVEATAHGLVAKLKYDAVPVEVRLPLVGAFQAENLAMSLGLLVGSGLGWRDVAKAATMVRGVPGRMELVAPLRPEGFAGRQFPSVIVDYAHKPDALQRVLEAARPLATKSGGKLWVVFGCGGNRDATKRPLMGGIAARLADEVIVTDDNPRFEDAGAVRAAVVAGAVGSARVREMGDRRKAIEAALDEAKPHDVIIVAGKGHEDGQIVNGVTLPFDDRMVVREVLG